MAGGYWRNGVLLAPKTGELLASKIAGIELSPDDERLLEAFKWDRFTAKDGGAKLAADARYAASMYPIHTRKSGTGVAASVGTELGSYSTATSAKDERARDRQALWSNDDNDDAFEKAAALGQKDGKVFTFGDEDSANGNPTVENSTKELPALQESTARTFPLSGEDTTDAYTVGYASKEEEGTTSMASIYETIQKNKSQQPLDMNTDEEPDQRPDPGFRVYYKNEKTGEVLEVPPYTSPGVFLSSLEQDKSGQPEATSSVTPTETTTATTASEESGYSEQTYDGYQDIIGANAASDRQAELEAMRKARMANRIDNDSELDLPDFYTQAPESSSSSSSKKDDVNESSTKSTSGRGFGRSTKKSKRKKSTRSSSTSSDTPDLSSVYDQIKQQKAATKVELDTETPVEEKPDPGFRVYYRDEQTGEDLEVPPYTSPGAFFASLEKKRNQSPPLVNGASSGSSTGTGGKGQNDSSSSSSDDYNERTYDGYQDIIGANGSSTNDRDEELKAMRMARQQNRLGQGGSTIEESDLHL